MHLDKQTAHACCNGSRRQRLDKLRLATRRRALAARQLHAVCGVENHWPAASCMILSPRISTTRLL